MLVTFAIVFINIGVYLFFAAHASSPLTVEEFSSSMALTVDALERGEFSRLITNLFFHFDFPHLGYNMVFLTIFGIRCEKIFGSRKFLLIYFISGIFSSLSIFLYPQGSVLAGASGAIFGILGSILVAQRTLYAHGFATSLLYGMVFFIIAVTTGFMAHLLGLIMGFVLGYVLTYGEGQRP